jgi:hypothetical protein
LEVYVNYFTSDRSVTVQTTDKTYTITKDHPRFDAIKQGLQEGNYLSEEHLIGDIDQIKLVEASFENDVLTIDGDVATYHGPNGDIVLNTSLIQRMIFMLRKEQSVDNLALFLENLMKNPSQDAIFELFGFLEKNDLPITDDGCFLAYKKVGGDYYDLYSHTFLNNIGSYVSMERHEVDGDRNRTCSTGLHFASRSYMAHYGATIEDGFRIVVVKINPRDVVSIPVDYNNAKGRCCAYEVVEELPADEFHIRPYSVTGDDYIYSEDDEDEDDGWFDEDDESW